MTVYESTSAARPRLRLHRAAKRHLDLLANSGSLMGATLVTSVLGFAYWAFAARAFPADTVGTASAAIAALTLVGTLSVFGMGTLLISELSRMPGREWNFIATCTLAASAVAIAGGLVYVALARFAVTGLRRSLGSPATTALLLAGIVVTAITLVLDDGLLGLLDGPMQLLRNTYFSVAKLAGLGVLVLLPISVHPGHLLTTWVGSGLLSMVLLAGSLRGRARHSRSGRRDQHGRRGNLRPQFALLRGRLRPALDHNLLNLALFVPRTTLPLIVTTVLSPTATAAFYAAFMMVSFVMMVPNHLATTLFAATAGDHSALRAKVRMALLISIGAGVPACLILALVAHPVMELFGHTYATTAAPALTILALTYPAMIFRPLYVAAARVLGRVRQASAFAIVAGIGELGGAWYGGSRGTLTSLALGLAAAFVLEGLATAPAVLRIALRRPNSWRHARQRSGRQSPRNPDPSPNSPGESQRPAPWNSPTAEYWTIQ